MRFSTCNCFERESIRILTPKQIKLTKFTYYFLYYTCNMCTCTCEASCTLHVISVHKIDKYTNIQICFFNNFWDYFFWFLIVAPAPGTLVVWQYGR